MRRLPASLSRHDSRALTAAATPSAHRFKLPKLELMETLVGVFVIMVLGFFLSGNF